MSKTIAVLEKENEELLKLVETLKSGKITDELKASMKVDLAPLVKADLKPELKLELTPEIKEVLKVELTPEIKEEVRKNELEKLEKEVTEKLTPEIESKVRKSLSTEISKLSAKKEISKPSTFGKYPKEPGRACRTCQHHKACKELTAKNGKN